MPRTATAARITKVFRYTTESGADIGSSGPMMSVTIPPTTASRKSRVWIRPPRVGSTLCLLSLLASCAGFLFWLPVLASCAGRGCVSGLLVACPPQPLLNGPESADPAAESAPRQVVGDFLSRDLQAEEGIDPREVTAKRGGTGCVHDSGAAARPAQLESPLDVKAAE